MRRFLSLLLALTMALGMLSFSLAEDTAAALPAVGDVVEGFEVVAVRDIPLIGATAVLFEHQKTGAALMYLANEDTNRVFDLTFRTRPVDDTGLPHVFEHATLGGSDKYPSKALWFNLSYQTYNTFMNAMTYDLMTTYPVASLSEAQLLLYADFYTDSCLHPMILTDESIFREEAWRYRLENAESELTIEGTVYSEMLGATTLDRAAMFNNSKAAFPGSVIGLDQGGNPDAIPEMTFEALKNYHNLFYHPSNCIAFLYGHFEDYTAFLRLLDEAFSPYEKVEFVFEDSGYTALTAPVTTEVAFPVEASFATENATSIYYTFVCPGLKDNPEAELALDTFTDLISAEASPMIQQLQEAMPSGSFGAWIETASPDDAIVFYATDVNRGDAETFRSIVDSAVADVAANGFSAGLVDAAAASITLSIRMVPESSSVGVDFIPNIAYNWIASGNPFQYVDYVDVLADIVTWNNEGRYAAAAAEWLKDSQTTALVTTYPEPGAKEEKDAALAASLTALKAGMTEEEIAALVAQTNDPGEEDNSSQYVKQLQAVTVASLPEEIRTWEIADTTDGDGIRWVTAEAAVEGVSSAGLLFSASAIPQEDLHWFRLFSSIAGKVNTSAHSYEELATLITRYLYSFTTRVSLLNRGEDFHMYLRTGFIALDDDLEAAYSLLSEILWDSDFSDAERLLSLVQNEKASVRSSINNSPYNMLIYRSIGAGDPVNALYDYLNFVSYYQFLEQTEALLENDPATAVAALQRVQKTLGSRTGAVATFAGSAESAALNAPLASACLKALPESDAPAQTYDLPAPSVREATVVEGAVNYNSLCASFSALGIEEDPAWDVISTLVIDLYLKPQLREQYGAYGVIHGYVKDGGLYICSYRDPNISQSFDVYRALPEAVRSMTVTQEELDGYILSSYAYYANSSGELAGSSSAIIDYLDGHEQSETLDLMRALKAVTPEAVSAAADTYALLVEKGMWATAGSMSAINANADLFLNVTNPFGAKDTSAIVFTDAGEDYPLHAEVRHVFELGLMSPLSDDVFGVDEQATLGELAYALGALVFEEPLPAGDALDALASYGVLPNEPADTVLTHGACDNSLVNLLALLGVEAQPDPESEITHTPMTRGELAEQLSLLAQMFGY